MAIQTKARLISLTLERNQIITAYGTTDRTNEFPENNNFATLRRLPALSKTSRACPSRAYAGQSLCSETDSSVQGLSALRDARLQVTRATVHAGKVTVQDDTTRQG